MHLDFSLNRAAENLCPDFYTIQVIKKLHEKNIQQQKNDDEIITLEKIIVLCSILVSILTFHNILFRSHLPCSSGELYCICDGDASTVSATPTPQQAAGTLQLTLSGDAHYTGTGEDKQMSWQNLKPTASTFDIIMSFWVLYMKPTSRLSSCSKCVCWFSKY